MQINAVQVPGKLAEKLVARCHAEDHVYIRENGRSGAVYSIFDLSGKNTHYLQ